MSAERSSTSQGGSSVLFPDRVLRVVLVDDEPATRKHLRILLSRQTGIEIIGEAKNGFEAVDMVERLRPDVVVMDMEMPGLDGLEATRRIRARRRDVRIIGFSCFDEAEMLERMIEAGADAYVVKTSPVEELIAAVLRFRPDLRAAYCTAPHAGRC